MAVPILYGNTGRQRVTKLSKFIKIHIVNSFADINVNYRQFGRSKLLNIDFYSASFCELKI